MDASRPGTDPLLRYPEPHRERIRRQARRLAEVLAAAVPPSQRGSGGAPWWEDMLYESILEQCTPRLRVEPGPPAAVPAGKVKE